MPPTDGSLGQQRHKVTTTLSHCTRKSDNFFAHIPLTLCQSEHGTQKKDRHGITVGRSALKIFPRGIRRVTGPA